MSRNPFVPAKDQSTEFGWGEGQFPDPRFDFSQRSGFPIADPDKLQQLMDLRASKRTNLQNPAEPVLPAFEGGQGAAPTHYQMGNTERYGAQPPLVRATRRPRYRRPAIPRKTYMQRSQDGSIQAAQDEAAKLQQRQYWGCD